MNCNTGIIKKSSFVIFKIEGTNDFYGIESARWGHHLVGGKADQGEDHISALVREVNEETSLQLSPSMCDSVDLLRFPVPEVTEWMTPDWDEKFFVLAVQRLPVLKEPEKALGWVRIGVEKGGVDDNASYIFKRVQAHLQTIHQSNLDYFRKNEQV